MICLGIESSCDETAAAVVEDGARVRSNVVSSQYVHAEYGGVVPELAARAHIRMLAPVVERALKDGGTGWEDIDLLAVTHAPGLMGALLTGLPFAKALALSTDRPFIGVNHLEGHLFALRLEYRELTPPLLALVLSGGHTELLVVEDWCEYRHLGSTIDDACGEAFDKVAKLLGLSYPGGAELERLAGDGSPSIDFPVPDPGGMDFSFSGLKTAVMYHRRDHVGVNPADVAASFQAAAIGQVIGRVQRALKETGLGRVGVSGGVASNGCLRRRLGSVLRERGVELFVPRPAYCSDNAAMIAVAGTERYRRHGPSPDDLSAFARLSLTAVQTG